MTYAVIQQTEGSSTSSGISTISTAAFGSSVTAGHQIVVFVATGAASSKTITVTRGSDTVTPAGTVLYNAAQGYEIQAFVIGSAAAGTTAVTANFSGAINDPSILAIECSGLSGTVAGNKYVEQDSPGTGADGVTSGNTGTLTTQPCGFFGIGYDITQVAASSPTAGTGFTSLTACWAFGGGVAWARPEHKRVTATTALPATFTAADGGSSFMVAAVAIAEGGTNYTLSVTKANVPVVGQTVTLTYATHVYTLPVTRLSVPVAGQTVNFKVGHTLQVTSRSVAVAGQSVTLTYHSGATTNYLLPVGTALVPVLMAPAFAGYALGVTALSVPVAGRTVTFVYAPAGHNVYVMPVSMRAVPVMGQNVGLIYGHPLTPVTCAGGSFDCLTAMPGLTL